MITRFCFIEISLVDGGPLIDFCSIERNYNEDETNSLLCINLSLLNIYIEIFGVVLINSYNRLNR